MKTVLITGATSGIGKELAKVYAKNGYNEVLVARRKELLIEVQEELINNYHVDVKYFVCDLTKKPKDVHDYCLKNNIKIDVLVNNAGYGDCGKFIDSDLDKQLGMIELNNKSLVSLTYYFIKDMKENGGGNILNVGSVASFVPGPNMAVYYATKAFVLSFSAAIRQELRNDNIRVTVLCPGTIKTQFWDRAGLQVSEDNKFVRSAEDVAKMGYEAMVNDKLYSVDGLAYKLAVGVVRHMPIELAAKAVDYIQTKTKKEL